LHGLGLGGVLYLTLLVIAILTLPVLWRPRWVERITRLFADRAVPLALWAGGVKVRASGLEHARTLEASRGYILMANHASNLDPLALMKVLGHTHLAFVAKAETLRRPVVGRLLRAVGWFGVDRDSPVSFKRFQEEVTARKKAGWVPNLVVFPEGTRSVDGTLQPFRMGAFLLAARCRLPMLPVIIRGTSPLHRRNAFACYPGVVRVDVLPPIEPPKLTAKDLVAQVGAMQSQAEELFRRVPDLNQVDGDLSELEPSSVTG
jgi:1-acyl-sn-glycerol-3-phosphate acyltransferase